MSYSFQMCVRNSIKYLMIILLINFIFSYWVLLPKLTTDLCKVHVIKLRKPELIDDLEPTSHLSQAIHFQEIRLKEDLLFKEILIADMSGLNWGYILKLTPPLLIKVLAICEKVFSNRIQGIYLINRFRSIQYIMDILKTIMKPKMFNKIHVCEDSSILHDVFPKEILPKDYGGDERSLEELTVMQEEKIASFKTRFEDLEKMKVNEKLRPERLENDEILGFHGNFKKLSVD